MNSEQMNKQKSNEMKRADHNVLRNDDTQSSITKGDPLHANSRKRIVEEVRMSGKGHSLTSDGGCNTFSSDSRNDSEIGLNPEPKLNMQNKRKTEGGSQPLSEIGQPNTLD